MGFSPTFPHLIPLGAVYGTRLAVSREKMILQYIDFIAFLLMWHKVEHFGHPRFVRNREIAKTEPESAADGPFSAVRGGSDCR
jgi:hypothetical protein